jgi:hypothetical protein
MLIIASCSENQEYNVTYPDKDPTFQMKMQVVSYDEPAEPISGASVKVWITEIDTVIQKTTDENGYIVLPEFEPQYILVTASHPEYYSLYHDERIFASYTDSIFSIRLIECIESDEVFPLSDSFLDGITWKDGKFWMTSSARSQIALFENEFETGLPDESWFNGFEIGDKPLHPTAIMSPPNSDTLWISYKSTNSHYLTAHDATNPMNILMYYKFYFFLDFGWQTTKEFPDDISWYNGDFVWSSVNTHLYTDDEKEQAFIARTDFDLSADSLTNCQYKNLTNLKFLTGVEYDGEYLWACNSKHDIFAMELNENHEVKAIKKRFRINEHGLKAITTDRNGNFWILSKKDGQNKIIKFRF